MLGVFPMSPQWITCASGFKGHVGLLPANNTKPLAEETLMTTVKWCVLIACFLPMLTALIPKISSLRLSFKDGKYDNNSPRAWEAQLVGWQQRAIAAHANGFEALPLFIAGVLFAQMGPGDAARIDTLAIAFVGLRVVYVGLYLLNQGNLRTLVWSAAVACNVALFF
jgi:uncharacterized MAPEG superfamily protein